MAQDSWLLAVWEVSLVDWKETGMWIDHGRQTAMTCNHISCKACKDSRYCIRHDSWPSCIDMVHPANSCVSSRFIQLWDSIRWTCHSYEETTWHQVTSTSVSLTKAQQAVVDLVLWLGRKRGPLSQTPVNRCLWCDLDQPGNSELILELLSFTKTFFRLHRLWCHMIPCAHGTSWGAGAASSSQAGQQLGDQSLIKRYQNIISKHTVLVHRIVVLSSLKEANSYIHLGKVLRAARTHRLCHHRGSKL